ncbi:MAG: hypothetical protein JRI25_06540 [Deltaproteobacteria bacterium]|nr:hypothetical protein [Deltaproteobacteria bacterium]
MSSGRAFRFRCASCGHTQMVPPPTNIQLTGTPTPSPSARTEAPTTEPPQGRAPFGSDSLYLKQEGKVYLVKDWDTLKRWVRESRVGMEDLISTGGVRWEPVGSRAELALLIAPEESDKTPVNPEPPPIAIPTPFPFGGETPFATASAPTSPLVGGVSSTEDIDGIPVGLPPLPAIDVVHSGATASEASQAPGAAAPKHSNRSDRSPLDAPTPSPPPGRATDKESDEDADVSVEDDLDSDDEFLAFDAGGDFEEEYDDWGGGMPRSRTPIIVAVVATAVILVAIVAYALWQPRAPSNIGEPQLGSVLTADEPLADEPTPPALEEEPEGGPGVAGVPEPTTEASSTGETDTVEPPGASEPPVAAEPEPPETEPEGGPRAPVLAPEPVATVAMPSPTTSPSPPPASVPTPVPEPTPPPPTITAAQLVDDGWVKVDHGDLAGAAQAFQKALEIAPRDAVANFGYGYVRANQGLPQEARPFLCRALQQAGDDVQTERETLAVLTETGLSCE